MATVLDIQHISKAYGPVQALRDVSFEVPEGAVFGVLGPNGSGKTTLLAILLDVLRADAGTYAWFGGAHHADARRQIGALLETPNFYHYLSAWDNLAITAAIRQNGLPDREKVLKQVGLHERRHSKFQTYSLGMKQRLAIGAALMGGPRVLVFDEPTNGLDPAGIAEIRELIKSLNKEGITIVLASHLLDEVEKVCTHVAILKRGNLLLSGPVDDVLRSDDTLEVRAPDMAALDAALSAMTGIRGKRMKDDTLELICEPGTGAMAVNAWCISNGITLSHLVLRKRSLESKFMELTEN